MTSSKLPNAILKRSLLILCLFCMMTSHSYGKERQWWFEVEVILFKHNRDANLLSESFTARDDTEQQDLQRQRQHVDLLSHYLKPDISVLVGALSNCSDLNKPTTEVSFDFLNLDPVLLDPNIAISDIQVDLVKSIEDPSANLVSVADQLDNPQQNLLTIEGSNVGGVADEYAEKDKYIVSVISPEASELESLEGSIPSDVHTLSQAVEDDFEDQIEDNIEKMAGEVVSSDDTQIQSDDAQLSPSFAYQFYEIHMAEFDIKSVEIPTQFNCVIAKPLFEIAQFSETEAPVVEIISEVPMKIDGTEWLYQDTPYLLAEKSLELAELVTSLKRKRDVRPLLHLGWRQDVLFDEANSKPVRLFAGINYADDFDANHMPLQESVEAPYVNPYPVDLKIESLDEQQSILDEKEQMALTQDDLIEKIRNALVNPEFVSEAAPVEDQDQDQKQEKTDELWQLEGDFTIFLKYIQGTPYLHIDSEFDFRAPVFNPELMLAQNTQHIDPLSDEKANNYLQNFHFKQLRRIISKQVHYFDHPLFGMIVQVRRHDRPEPEAMLEDSQIENEQQ
jgi:hypothetical protein